MAMLLYVRYYLNMLWGYMFKGQSRGSVWLQIFMVIMWAAVPCFLGRHMGNASLEQMVSTHKNAAILQHLRMENTFLYTMLIRIINILPFDIMSAYFGATRTRFAPYLLGSILGMISSCVLFPILGTNITDPRSPQFLISAAIELVIMAASFLLLVYVRRKAAAEEETA